MHGVCRFNVTMFGMQ